MAELIKEVWKVQKLEDGSWVDIEECVTYAQAKKLIVKLRENEETKYNVRITNERVVVKVKPILKDTSSTKRGTKNGKK